MIGMGVLRFSAMRGGGGGPLAPYAAGGVEPQFVADFTAGKYFVDGVEVDFASAVTFSASPTFDADGLIIGAGNTLTVPAVNVPFNLAGITVAIEGQLTNNDSGSGTEQVFFQLRQDANNYLDLILNTGASVTGRVDAYIRSTSGGLKGTYSPDHTYSALSGEPFHVAVSSSPSGTSLACEGIFASTNATQALIDLSGRNLLINKIYGRIGKVRIWNSALAGSALEEASVKQKEVHVFALAGQSNMVGQATYDAINTYPEFTSQWTSGDLRAIASPHLDFPSYTSTYMSAAIQFARDYRAANPEVEIMLVPVAKIATGFNDGNWNKGDPEYEYAVAQTNKAIAGVPGATLKGILWVQGERDAADSISQSAYADYLDAMIADMRSDITGAGDVPFIAGQIGTFLNAGTYPTASDINAAIADLANRVSNTGYASSATLTDKGDSLHYSAASLRTLGSRMYDALSAL